MSCSGHAAGKDYIVTLPSQSLYFLLMTCDLNLPLLGPGHQQVALSGIYSTNPHAIIITIIITRPGVHIILKQDDLLVGHVLRSQSGEDAKHHSGLLASSYPIVCGAIMMQEIVLGFNFTIKGIYYVGKYPTRSRHL